jgi:hypothetical protein
MWAGGLEGRLVLTGFVAAAIGVMLLFPQSLAGSALRRLLVEAPAAVLNRMRRGHVILLVAVAAALAAALLLGREALMVSAMSMPEGVAWLAAFDIATYVDVAIAALAVAAAVPLKAMSEGLRSSLRRLRSGRPRAARFARGRRRKPPPPDPEPWPIALVAVASS